VSTIPNDVSTPSLLAQARLYPILPPVTITHQALFQFNLSIHRQLVEFEIEFGGQKQPLALSTRKEWLPPLRKPR
jgi:hypothetical protein